MSIVRKLTTEELDLLRADRLHRCFVANCTSQAAWEEVATYIRADGTPMKRLWHWCNACHRDRESKVKKKVKERAWKSKVKA